MASEIVEGLKGRKAFIWQGDDRYIMDRDKLDPQCQTAAAEIESLQARVRNLEEALKEEQRKFQQETLATSARGVLLQNWADFHREEHRKGLWNRGCFLCRMVTKTDEMLTAPINVRAALKDGT